MRLKLTLAYDGAPYAGWQRQASGDTIQARVESAITRITGEPATVHGAGRTDAGVHALGQTAHFDAPATTQLDPATWTRALNANLPATIRVMQTHRVPPAFHARFAATAKTYRYTIHTGEILPPFAFERAWHVPQPIDTDLLRRALALYVGRHDFRALSANRGSPVPDTTRVIYSADLTARSNTLTLTFTGSGFLYKMVRILTAASVRVALHRESPAWLAGFLQAPSGPKCHHVAPADGLTLVRVSYTAR